MTTEDRLHRALHDGDWSLPVWAAPAEQLHRAARRRVAVASVAAIAAIAALTAGVVVPLSLAGGSSTTPIAKHPHRHTRLPLPRLGAPGFPTSIYPAPGKTPQHSTIACPSLAGTDAAPPPLDTSAYQQLASDFGKQSFTNDLRRSDRSLWPALRHEYRNLVQVSGVIPVGKWHTVRVKPAREDSNGPSSSIDCGDALVDRSVALTFTDGPQDFGTTYVLSRHGHLLIWGPMPYVPGTGGADPYEGETRRYARLHPVACGEVFQSFTETRRGPDPSVTFRAHLPKDYFRCGLRGWLSISLASSNGRSLRPHLVGVSHQVILKPGDSATVTIRARHCAGPTTSYEFAYLGDVPRNQGIRATIALPVGPCGVDEGPYVKP
jgi:hypothetical protein